MTASVQHGVKEQGAGLLRFLVCGLALAEPLEMTGDSIVR